MTFLDDEPSAERKGTSESSCLEEGGVGVGGGGLGCGVVDHKLKKCPSLGEGRGIPNDNSKASSRGMKEWGKSMEKICTRRGKCHFAFIWRGEKVGDHSSWVFLG